MFKLIVDGNPALEGKIAGLILEALEPTDHNHKPQIKELIIMPKYKATQEDFEIEVAFKGTDAEGNLTKKGVTANFVSTNETAASIVSQSGLKAVVHVGGPNNDSDAQGSIEVTLTKNRTGEVVGFGSLPIIVTAGDADTVSEVVITGAPEGEPEETPEPLPEE